MSPVRLGILVTPWASLPLQPLPCLLTLSLGSAVYAEIPPTFPLWCDALTLSLSAPLTLSELSLLVLDLDLDLVGVPLELNAVGQLRLGLARLATDGE